MSSKVTRYFKFFIPLCFAITAVFGMMYLTVQQNYRMSANDPQIAIAYDSATMLEEKNRIVLPDNIDLRKSISPFIILYDKTGKIIRSSATLDGQIPLLPSGIFTTVDRAGESRFTWEPKNGVRIATVIIKVPPSAGYILVGRSLKEIEIREDNLLLAVASGWLATTLVTSILIFFLA